MSKSTAKRVGGVEDSYPDDMIRTGEKIKQCPVTGTEYRVTRWAVRMDGRIVPLEKEALDDE